MSRASRAPSEGLGPHLASSLGAHRARTHLGARATSLNKAEGNNSQPARVLVRSEWQGASSGVRVSKLDIYTRIDSRALARIEISTKEQDVHAREKEREMVCTLAGP